MIDGHDHVETFRDAIRRVRHEDKIGAVLVRIPGYGAAGAWPADPNR